MPNDFEQFKGPGAKYAPKPKAKQGKPAQAFTAPAPAPRPSVEDQLRSDYRDESRLVNPRNQSTDHMN